MQQPKQVWVAFATPEQQLHIAVTFYEGMTAQQAIQASAITEKVTLPEPLQLGIFGSKIDENTVLQVGDRVEIYRPLTINPKDIRRKRAAQYPVGRLLKSNRLRSSGT